MRVDLEDMTDRERFVLTKAQLLDFLNDCVCADADVYIAGQYVGDIVPEFTMSSYIEVEEVLGE